MSAGSLSSLSSDPPALDCAYPPPAWLPPPSEAASKADSELPEREWRRLNAPSTEDAFRRTCRG